SKYYLPGSPEIFSAKDLEDAAKTAKKIAHVGDIVALSPGCASFDMYSDFEERGEHFIKIINSF
ncbi:MAG: UDP-N-acetylmuramoyl-L-alanine--D-glutamate ligase, partial [Clostridia bacterium]|nr:UDP-N-acetylmuramoyl-L-alanine--D-glutamate ligase [Clostridia bacterium]